MCRACRTKWVFSVYIVPTSEQVRWVSRIKWVISKCLEWFIVRCVHGVQVSEIECAQFVCRELVSSERNWVFLVCAPSGWGIGECPITCFYFIKWYLALGTLILDCSPSNDKQELQPCEFVLPDNHLLPA